MTPTTSVKIAHPANGATVTLTIDGTLPVALDVENFTLKAPGTCAGAANCGHAYLRVDGAACDYGAGDYDKPDGGNPYNAVATGTYVSAYLRSCLAQDDTKKLNGPHKISVELRKDDGTPQGGTGATHEIDVTVTGELEATLFVSRPAIDTSSGFGFGDIEGIYDGNPELFAFQMEFPPYAVNAFHLHTAPERVVIIEGSAHFATPARDAGFNLSAGRVMRPGDWVHVPSPQPMWVVGGPRGARFMTYGVNPDTFRPLNPPVFRAQVIAAGGSLHDGGGYLIANPADPAFDYCLSDGGSNDGGCPRGPNE